MTRQPRDLETFRRMWDEAVPIDNIATALGVKRATVLQYRRMLRLPWRVNVDGPMRAFHVAVKENVELWKQSMPWLS